VNELRLEKKDLQLLFMALNSILILHTDDANQNTAPTRLLLDDTNQNGPEHAVITGTSPPSENKGNIPPPPTENNGDIPIPSRLKGIRQFLIFLILILFFQLLLLLFLLRLLLLQLLFLLLLLQLFLLILL